MQKPISSKTIALIFGILTISFLAAFYVVAWQEPAQSPPDGNAAAPLNVGSTGQIKTGNLVINALGVSGTGANLFSMPYGAGTGKVLTSDASGNGSWQVNSGPSGILRGFGFLVTCSGLSSTYCQNVFYPMTCTGGCPTGSTLSCAEGGELVQTSASSIPGQNIWGYSCIYQ